MKTKNARMTLHSTLNSILPSYYAIAQDNHGSDYAVYTIDEVSHEDGRTVAQLEINVYGYGTDTETIEENSDAIQKTLDHGCIITDNATLITYIDRRQSIVENDTRLLRRRLLFDLYLYERT